MRARNYCFTVNHEPQRFYDKWSHRDLTPEIQFMVFQLEVAPETGHLHVQGYLQLTKQLGYARVQTLLRSRCHLEAAKGSAADNITYCTKEASRLDGPIPFIMSGWRVVAGEKAYEGKLVRGDEVVIADPVGQKWSNIFRKENE